MSRLIPHRDMSPMQLYRCCSEARAILNLCHQAAWTIQNSDDHSSINRIADDIGEATRLAAELLDPVSDALESHQGFAADGGAA